MKDFAVWKKAEEEEEMVEGKHVPVLELRPVPAGQLGCWCRRANLSWRQTRATTTSHQRPAPSSLLAGRQLCRRQK